MEEMDVKNMRQVRGLKERLSKELMTLLERRIEQAAEIPPGFQGADTLLFSIEATKMAYEQAADLERRFAQDRQFRVTLVVATIAAVSTAVYATAYIVTMVCS